VASSLDDGSGKWDALIAAAYGDVIKRELAWYEDQLEQFRYESYARQSGQVVCDGFVSHELWFGLMRVEGLDWPCPSCGAQI
jgi:hypothetical protein